MLIKTERLILREWREEDLQPFAEMNADPRVMEYFPATLTKHESDALAKRIREAMNEHGWGLWAVSVPEVSEFIGFIGLAIPTFTAHFTPAVEVGWRLAYQFWGKGYATEGASAALAYGFDKLNLNEIVSFTAAGNTRSIEVMKKIGMQRNPEDDFDHPKLPEGHMLRKHVLYRIQRQNYKPQPTQNSGYKDYEKICVNGYSRLWKNCNLTSFGNEGIFRHRRGGDRYHCL